jgi:hypothetical protein
VTTTDVLSGRLAGARLPPAVAELALPALTVTLALQLLRLMVSTQLAVQRDRLGAPLAVGPAGAAHRLPLALARPGGERLRRHRGHGQRPPRGGGHRPAGPVARPDGAYPDCSGSGWSPSARMA